MLGGSPRSIHFHPPPQPPLKDEAKKDEKVHHSTSNEDEDSTESEKKDKPPFTLEELEEMHEKMGSVKSKPAESAILRETFYHIVRAKYWEMIESGHLPRNSSATLVLLNSIEESLDNTHLPVMDWDILQKVIATKINGQFARNVEKFANYADDLLPDWFLFDNEIHYALNFKMYEVVYYICQGFCEAHADAEHKLATFFGDSPLPDTPEEIEVCLESCQLRDAAANILSSVDPKLVEMIKTKIVAENLLELEYNYVVKLIHEGVLTEGDAEGMFHQIHEDERALTRSRKEQARELAAEKQDEDAEDGEAGEPTIHRKISIMAQVNKADKEGGRLSGIAEAEQRRAEKRKKTASAVAPMPAADEESHSSSSSSSSPEQSPRPDGPGVDSDEFRKDSKNGDYPPPNQLPPLEGDASPPSPKKEPSSINRSQTTDSIAIEHIDEGA